MADLIGHLIPGTLLVIPGTDRGSLADMLELDFHYFSKVLILIGLDG